MQCVWTDFHIYLPDEVPNVPFQVDSFALRIFLLKHIFVFIFSLTEDMNVVGDCTGTIVLCLA
jgi:hypothetical protein